MRGKLRGLYVVLDPQLAGERDLREMAAAALRGGARLLQLRDKSSDKGVQLPLARNLALMCEEAGALFLVNDHLDLALAGGAHGVHLGQQDLPVDAVRAIVPSGFIIGTSTNNADEARQAEAAGADYVSVGRLFPTVSKLNTRPATLDTLRSVKAAVRVPVCAIGGINESNIESVVAAGADMAAVIAAVVSVADPEAAARSLASRFS